MNNLFTVLGGKFKFSAQDSDTEYLCWRCKNSPVPSDLKPSLANTYKQTIQGLIAVLTGEKKTSEKMASSSLQNNKSWLHAK